MEKITPFIWFEDHAEEAAKFYVKVFGKGSRIVSSTKLKGTPSGPNTYTLSVKLGGKYFTFINGGKIQGTRLSGSSAVSFVINCKDQKEVDHFWNALVRGGKPIQCGWLKDRYGVTWQVVPTAVPKLLGGTDPEGRARATKAMLKMIKLDIKKLHDAYYGRSK